MRCFSCFKYNAQAELNTNLSHYGWCENPSIRCEPIPRGVENHRERNLLTIQANQPWKVITFADHNGKTSEIKTRVGENTQAIPPRYEARLAANVQSGLVEVNGYPFTPFMVIIRNSNNEIGAIVTYNTHTVSVEIENRPLSSLSAHKQYELWMQGMFVLQVSKKETDIVVDAPYRRNVTISVSRGTVMPLDHRQQVIESNIRHRRNNVVPPLREMSESSDEEGAHAQPEITFTRCVDRNVVLKRPVVERLRLGSAETVQQPPASAPIVTNSPRTVDCMLTKQITGRFDALVITTRDEYNALLDYKSKFLNLMKAFDKNI